MGALLLAGCNSSDKEKLAKLEVENKQLREQLQAIEAEHPPIDATKLLQLVDDQLGKVMPASDKPGFKAARAMLAGVNAVHDTLQKQDLQLTKNSVTTLHMLQDLWPAYLSPANSGIDPMFQSCRDLPVLNRIALEAALNDMTPILNKASELEKLVRFQCSLALSAAVMSKQANK